MFGISCTQFFKKYSLGGYLGTGSTALVLEAISNQDGLTYAVKVFDRFQMVHHGSRIDHEIEVLSHLDHPNAVRLIEHFRSETHVLLVFEKVDQEDLFDYIQSREGLPEPLAVSLMRELVSILSHLHQQHIIHRDIKPENILLLSGENDNKRVKLADFGSSCVLKGEDEKVSRMIGTLEYFAPEQLAEEPYGKAVDMWALGVTCFAMLTARCVFYDEDEEEKWNQVMTGDLRKIDELVGFSEESKDFMRKLLTVDPDKRMTALEAKDHPWLNSSQLPSKSKTTVPSPFIQRTNEITSLTYNSPFKTNRMLSPMNINTSSTKPKLDKFHHVVQDLNGVKKDLNFHLEPLF